MLNGKKGFTLIELLIVIVIIGILAGIVVGIVGTTSRRKANDAKKKAAVHEVQNALEQYHVDTDCYPATTLAAMKTALGTTYLAANAYTEGLTYTSTSAACNASYTLSFTLANTVETGENIVGGVYSVTNRQ